MVNSQYPNIVLIIASVSRPDELGRWQDHVARQTVKPNQMIWVVHSQQDLPSGLENDPGVPLDIIKHPMGSTKQRNAGLDNICGTPDFIIFFDDDYVPTDTCIADVVASFAAFPEAVGLTGKLLADGAQNEGLGYAQALQLIASHQSEATSPAAPTFEPWQGLYGCNMAFRGAAVGAHRFDERLPLYGWQEDVDFAMRVAAGRPLGRTNGFVGVHQGVKRGRTSGRRFGYSQITNPTYLWLKGSMTVRKLLDLTVRNFIANHVRMLRPEPWVDRRGRAVGNWLALADIVRGRITPERILKL